MHFKGASVTNYILSYHTWQRERGVAWAGGEGVKAGSKKRSCFLQVGEQATIRSEWLRLMVPKCRPAPSQPLKMLVVQAGSCHRSTGLLST